MWPGSRGSMRKRRKKTKADQILSRISRTWETLLVRGMGKAVYEECRYLQELADAEALNAESLQKFYNDFTGLSV